MISVKSQPEINYKDPYPSVVKHMKEMDKDAEAQLLPLSSVPTHMRYSHIWKAANTCERAFRTDPYLTYLRADAKPRTRAQTVTEHIALLSIWNIHQLILTVDGGSALIVVWPDMTKETTPFRKFLARLTGWIATPRRQTEEQKKRYEEANVKAAAVLKETIGDRHMSMIFLGLIATDPQSQGHGYGGALIEAINDLADSHGRATWLISSNVLNDVFYHSHGYETVGTFYMGAENPKWTENPVPVQVMVREPKRKSEVAEPLHGGQRVSVVNPLLPFMALI